MAISTAKQFVAAYEKYGSVKAVSRKTKTSYYVTHGLYQQALAENLMTALPRGAKTRQHMAAMAKGKVKAKKPRIGGRKRRVRAVPIERHPEKVTRFLFTCAQNNTKINEPFWTSLLALKEFYNAELHISRFAYLRRGLGARGDKESYFANVQSGKPEDFWFDPRLEPYLSDDRREVAPGLVWCGEANISPTAARPLSSLETFTGRASSIFPHVKIAMESVPSSLRDPVKFMYTTGTVTQRNYIQRKEGLKADFHHCYGALLVEVEPNGDWWCRQINADSEGTIYDIDVCVKKGEVYCNNKALATRRGAIYTEETFLEGIKWGDVHVAQMDSKIREVCWGEGGVLDTLRPKHQFLDDTFDMFARNHHEIDDQFRMLERFVAKADDVRQETADVATFIAEARRPFCKTVVVNSNHDRAISRWLKNKNAVHDPVNLAFHSRMRDRVVQHITANGDQPVILREAYLEVTEQDREPRDVIFLKQGDNFLICPAAGGIDNGQHGDDGPDGTRGTTLGFTKVGRKMNRGHGHKAGIADHVYDTGCCLDLQNPPKYLTGPSSWSNSHVPTYVNGKRQVLTHWGEHKKLWADR